MGIQNRPLSLLFMATLAFFLFFCTGKEEIAQTRIIALSGDLNFGTVEVGKTSTKTLTINNTGNTVLKISSLILPAKFSGSFSGSIAAGASQAVTITFSPDKSGSFDGKITVNGDQSSGTNTIDVTGTGFQATKSISITGDLNFGSVTLGETSQKVLVITNTGNTALTVSGLVLPAGFSGTFSGTIAPGASQNVVITFTPTQVITYSGNATVTADHASGTNTLVISGAGTQAPTKIIALNPNTLDFGSVEVNKTSQKTFVIQNTGNANLTVSGLTLPNGYTANWSSGTIQANASVTVTVTFAPASAGTFNGSITIASNANSGMNTLNITGTGAAAGTRIIGLSGALSFGSVEINKSSAKTLTINNTGNSALTITSLSMPAGFTGTYSGTIAAGGSQSVVITFAPTQAVAYSGNITVNGNQTSGTNTIAVSGTGTTVADALAVYRKIYGATSITEEGNYIVIKTNGLPDHKSPYYKNTQWESTMWVNDTRAGFNQNPSVIASFNYTFRIPKNPTPAANPTALGSSHIGVAINGIPFFNQYAAGNQTLGNEIVSFDLYGGHPAMNGDYHYHVEPTYLTMTKGNSALMGFLLDGYPVYGPYENGVKVTNANLDVYHGHSHATADYPNGIYHYHITAESPYINGNGYYGVPGTWSR